MAWLWTGQQQLNRAELSIKLMKVMAIVFV